MPSEKTASYPLPNRFLSINPKKKTSEATEAREVLYEGKGSASYVMRQRKLLLT